jgi:hypothetical protein
VIPSSRAAEDAKHVLERGPVRVLVEPRRPGMTVFLDGVAVSTGSELVATTPPWTPHFYVGPTPAAVTGAVRETLDDGAQRLSLTHHGERGAFVGTETLTLHTDGRLEQLFAGRFTESQGAALVQWRIASLPAAVFAGCEYEVTRRGAADALRGRSPMAPVEESAPAATVAAGFQTITWQSRVGTIRIDVDATRPLVIYDYRRSQWADARDPYFWFGDRGTRLSPGESVRYAITWHFPPAQPAREAAGERRVRPRVTPVPDARSVVTDAAAPVRIIPTPKSVSYEAGYTLVAAEWQAIADGELPRAAAAARRELAERWPAAKKSEPAAAAGPFADAPTCNAIHFAAADDAWELPAEGYEIIVAPQRVTLRAADAAGFRHAVRTLVQLAIPLGDGRRAVRRVQIRDWPTLPFRGVHFFTGGGGSEIHERLLRDVVAMLKLNHAVIEAEYIRWDGHDNIHHPTYGMSKADAARIVDACGRYGIEAIPLVQSLGHCQWMFVNDANLELAEDPEAKWAYCVTNPNTYDFIFDVYQQAIDLFRPRYFHIGHDEFNARGRVPFRESSLGYTAEELFITDTLRLHEWLTARGLTTMMWGDELLGPGEAPDACHAASAEAAAGLRARLPGDIVITDWHYAVAPPEKFTSLSTFQARGHRTIAATWHRPGNITSFARAAADQKSFGLLQTTWAGYSLDEVSFSREREQYEAWVLAAEAAWNADRDITLAPHRAAWHFHDLWQGRTADAAPRPGHAIDLRGVTNTAIHGPDERLLRGLARPDAPIAAPRGRAAAGEPIARFDMPQPEEIPVLILAGRLAREPHVPPAVTFELELTAREFTLLATTNAAAPRGTAIARLVVEFAAGPPATLDLLYGEHVAAYDDLTACPAARVLVDHSDDAERPYVLRATTMPLPADRGWVRSLRIESLDAAASLIVAGIVAVE